MELKIKAAMERKSVAAVIREKLVSTPQKRVKKGKSLVDQMRAFGKEMAKKYPDLNLTKGLIEMRYEQ